MPGHAHGLTGFGQVTAVTVRVGAEAPSIRLTRDQFPADRVARLENGEDAERGREARNSAPRAGHADWAPARTRPDPWKRSIVRRQSRLAELVPIRYGRMLATPFTFFRGAAAVMAADLADTPSSGLVVQACGDAHISNFGGFAAPDRRLVFGPNDFDETLPGPWEWDVKRMAASIEIAGRDIDLPAGRRRPIVERAVREYREGDARVRPGELPRRLVRAPRRRRVDRPVRHEARRRRPPAVHPHLPEGTAKDQRPGRPEADRGGRREAAIRERPAAADASARALRRGPERAPGVRAGAAGAVHRRPPRRSPAPRPLL